jgi:hypothetical protein
VGGKTATSSQQVAVPAQVLAQYASVNSAADQTAQTPFSTYNGTGTPVSSGYTAANAGNFVAPVNAEQNQGIAGTNAAANEAQPYYGAATGVLGASQAGVNPINAAAESGTAASSAPLTGNQINQYLSPYLGDVLGSTEQIQNQENQQAQAGQLGNAITSGAFGGDRTGIAAANLQQQEDLANSNVISGIANTGYQSALSTAQGQQQIGLAGANQLASIGSTAYGEGANTASELGSLGTGAQTAGIAGSQAQIAAGTVQQQTQQAQDTAQYNQFLQQQSYPFQVDQFLASIAEGTGSLSGSTTTTTQPGGFFSDERLKEDMQPVGKTFDGQTIYRYKIKGDPRDRIGLSAQKTEKKHPDAVGLAGGFRYVDYGKATEDAANRGHFYAGGVVPMRAAYAYGGAPDNSGGLGAVLQAQQSMYASPSGQQRNIGSQTQGTHQLAVASGTPAPPTSGSSKAQTVEGLGKDAYQGYKYFNKPTTPTPGANTGVAGSGPAPGPNAATAYGAGDPAEATPGASPLTSTVPDAGLETAAPAQASGIAGADTGAAAGAGDVAAAGAGDAAAGAATGAAAGAAAEGGADAAAALAAEYAAADVAAAAIIAAKRGGAIRRKRDLGGGTPYEGDGSDPLDIPDDQNTTKLQTAGPLVKQPTGLQSAMKMGDPTQASSMAGSMFSNEALARGGVAGRGLERRGRFADGGTPDQDSDPGDMATAPDPDVSAAAPASSGVAGGSGIWDTIKKHATAENVLPILSGLAAMGTAKTRSPGVALAAGLGAGSQSYLDTRKTQADIANEQAKTQGVTIANQLGAMKNQAAAGYLGRSTPGQSTGAAPGQTPSQAQAAPPVPAPSPAGAQQEAADPAAVAQSLSNYYKNKYAVTPWLPDEQATLQKNRGAAIALGTDQPIQDATAARDIRVQNQTYANQKAAQVEADQLYKTATTDPDPGARQAAEAKYNAIHQWTGDTWDDKEGNRVNSRTSAPAIGVAKQTLPPSGNVLTDSFGRQYTYDQQTNKAVPVGVGRGSSAPAGGTAPPSKSAPSTGGGSGFAQPVADQPRILQEVANTRTAGDAAPQVRNINQQLLQLSSGTSTGPMTATVQKLAAAAGLKSGSSYQEINAYLERQAATSAAAMGVPHTNAGLAASQSATGTTEYTPAALQEKVKFADAVNSGAMAYREGLDNAIGTGDVPNLKSYQKFRSAWAKNFDPDVYRADDAIRRGDVAELNNLKQRLGSQGMKVLAQKSANLRALENGQIPP